MMKISVVVPVYNEASTIGQVLDELSALDFDKEIVVVDDGSEDGTAAIIQGHAGELVRARLPANQGKGSALRHGFSLARGDIVVVQDADLELSPAMIARLVEPIAEGRADAVYGSRFLEGAGSVPLYRRFANRLLTGLANVVYGVRLTDMETAHKAFRRDLLDGLELQSCQFEIEVELTAKLARSGARILEIPSPYRPRTQDEGKKIRFRDGLQALATVWRYRTWRP